MKLFKETIFFIKLVGVKKFFLLLFLTILGSLFDLIGIGAFIPLLMDGQMPLVDGFIQKNQFLENIVSNKRYLSLSIIIFFIFRGAISFLLTRSIFSVSISLLNEISVLLIKLIYKCKYKVTQEFKNMEIVNDALNVTRIYIDDFFKQILKILSDFVPLVLIFIIINSIIDAYTIAIFVIIVSVSIFLIRLIIFRKFQQYGHEILKNYEKILNKLDISIRNLRELKFYKLDNYFKFKLDEHFSDVKKLEVEYNSRNQLPKYLIEILIISIFIYLFLQNYYVQPDPFFIEKIVVIGVAAIRIMPVISNLIIAFGKIKYASVSSTKIYELIKFLNTHQENNDKINIVSFKDNKIAIEAKKISFSYSKNLILDKVSFKIFKNEINLIYGKSGSGKTTLANIISNLYKPSKGKILYQKEYDFSILPQKPVLFDDSILFNVILDKSFSLKKTNEVIKKSSLDNFLKNKKLLLEIVGTGSRNISEGELQRLAIARNLYMHSDIIIFDEPTSSLDVENKKIIINLLKKIKNEKIIIVISHDNDLIKIAKNKIFLKTN
tara:strand:- start:1759 stop:3408 length:1650 start_codon:yes stop_codon:yes gene_type:complete